MNLIRSLMGRRQFLAAAGVTSASAMALGKLAGVVDPVLQIGAATAADKSEASVARGASDRYGHILSPIRIRNTVLKNRMMQTVSFPHFMQGPETFPSAQVISHYWNIAKNGAAVISCVQNENTGVPRKELTGEAAHFPMWDCDDVSVHHYFAQMADTIHFFDSKASMGFGANEIGAPQGYDISDVPLRYGDKLISVKEISVEQIKSIIEEVVRRARLYQSLGYDMVDFHMSYQGSIFAHSLSPVYNKRKDRYGGSLENRARLPLELFQAIKKACGQNFLIGAHISGEEDAEGGYTVQDAVQYAKIWEGSLDILGIRAKDAAASHPSGYDSIKNRPVTLPYAQAIKESGAKIVVAPVGGYQDLDFNEECIATGKADIIAMARAWIADPEYGKKAYEGRGEDVVPCVRCGECSGEDGSHRATISMCTVNPLFGIAHEVNRMIDAPGPTKRVAVIGGGPAGMKAAVTAVARGHKVTLFERNDFLGGQLKHTDYASFKWPYREFKDYLIRQVYKSGVEVHLSTKATPEMIKAKGYDAVMIAVGADPVIPEIPGARGGNVLAPVFVYNNKNIGKNVVVIGNDQIGTDTALYLTENGHNVTVIKEKRTDSDNIAIRNFKVDITRGPNRDPMDETTTEISDGKVTYLDAKGVERSVLADTVVISAGRSPRQDEAMRFAGAADQVFFIGDCRKAGNVWNSQRTAFAAASQP